MSEKVVPYLWFNTEAEEATQFYASVIPDSRVVGVQRGPDGKAMIVTFELAGREFIALNGGPQFTFNESFSVFVRCEDQAEVDRLWAALTANGGEEGRCGWLKDRYGLSWQIIPNRLVELLSDQDPERSGRAMQAMLGMQKIEIAGLERAAAGAAA
jgi:predicted 3-demethylubiquinone-9 3-methyltransferase (glyoxalase superfamily)